MLVLLNGQPLTVNFAAREIPAILEAWWPGVRGGPAIAKALFGEINPSGKLTVTFPKAVGQLEYNFPFKKGSHGEQPKYTADPNGYGFTRVEGPLFPFGYGLSYTSFEYSDLAIGKDKVSFRVTNTGSRAGAEIAQLYIRDRYASVVTYDSVLRGFEKVFLKSGESREISFPLGDEELRILGKDMKWVVEPGEFDIKIGASSTDIRLRGTLFR